MPTYNFDAITHRGKRSGVCPKCRKYGVRTQGFTQTVNPFNTNADGLMKTRDEIRSEVSAEAKKWAESQFVHVRCES